MARALIVVDVQNDFCEGGSLAVAGGAQVAAGISTYLERARSQYAIVVATRDWHVNPGSHFSEHPDYHDSWPAHCVAGTTGAAFHPALKLDAIDLIVSKGMHAAAYSGFEGETAGRVSLDQLLREAGVTDVDVVGLATDYCVRATALDANKLGFGVRVLVDLCAGVAPDTAQASFSELRAADVELLDAASA